MSFWAAPRHNIKHFCVRELGTSSRAYLASALTGGAVVSNVVWMTDLCRLRCSFSAHTRCENGHFAASAQTLRQLSLRIESLRGSVSNRRGAAASVQRDSADLLPHSQPNSTLCALESVVSIFPGKSLTSNLCFVTLSTLSAKFALFCI